MAIGELWTDDQAAASRRLDALTAQLDRLMQAGIERNGAYKLRAELLALRGDGNGAMLALRHAAELGWREAASMSRHCSTERPCGHLAAVSAASTSRGNTNGWLGDAVTPGQRGDERRLQISRFATDSAFFSMNSRRGST